MRFDVDVEPVPRHVPCELCALMHKHGSDKGHPSGTAAHNYSRYYHALFAPMRTSVTRIFELGIFCGSSLRAWREYFPKARVFGADIDRRSLFHNETRIETFFCDQTEPDSIDAMWRVPALAEPFDIIIDDALHTPEANKIFLERSFHKLRPGGIYVIEDLLEPGAFRPLMEKWRAELPIDACRLLELPHPGGHHDNNLLIMRRAASKRRLITFSGAGYESTTERIVEDGPRFGADEVLVYDDRWLMGTDFYWLNHWRWEVDPPRCFGYCSWKPFIILDTLKRCADGDVVLYTDGDCYPIADLSPVYEIAARDGAWLARASAHQNRPWCKRDTYVVMGQDEPKYYDAAAGCARYCAFQKGPWKPTQFLYEWLTYSVNRRANTKAPSVLGPELPGFEENRDEQAIMTLLAHRYGYTLHREACDAGEGFSEQPGDYPQLFVQAHQGHRAHPTTGSRFRNV
jgi:hypothetical protein